MTITFRDNDKFDTWLKEKHNIDGWRHYYYLKECIEGWSREKINVQLDNLLYTMMDEERDTRERFDTKYVTVLL